MKSKAEEILLRSRQQLLKWGLSQFLTSESIRSEVMIQEYLLLSDDDKQRGALNSLDLVGSTAQLREENRICVWLEDVWSER